MPGSRIGWSALATATAVASPVVRASPSPAAQPWTGRYETVGYDWIRKCGLSDGYHQSRSPATSWVFYDPQPDGSLKGARHTDIAEGPCRGSVITPVAAFPG